MIHLANLQSQIAIASRKLAIRNHKTFTRRFDKPHVPKDARRCNKEMSVQR